LAQFAFALLFAEQVKGLDAPMIMECEPMLEAWVTGNHSSQPYIGCYMTTDYLGGNQTVGSASAVRVTVSFKGTDQSIIQSDNWLMAGIAAQGPDGVYGGCNAIDWGYTFGLWVAPYLPQPHFHAEVFEGHEWVNCLPGYVKSIHSWTSTVPGLTINSSVTLIMQWTEETLDYSVEVDGVSWFLCSYTPNETALHYFMTGTVDRSWGIFPLPNTVKFLQFFGAWSNYNIGHVGWRSKLSHLGYIKTGESSWTDVSFAYSTDGLNSYWDNTLGWGGAAYENVKIYSTNQKTAFFYPNTAGITTGPDTLLWPLPSGGGCPYVYTWDGQQYAIDNNLLPASEMSNGIDVEDYYRLEQPLIPVYQGMALSLYSLQIREFENEHDFIDHVKLIALDHASDVKITVTPEGEILTYRQPLAPLWCIDNNGTNRLNEIASTDGNVSDPTTYFEGYPDDYLILNFGKIDTENAKLILRTDMKKMDECILVQIKDSNGEWQTVEVLVPRAYWSMEAVNLSPYIDKNENLMVRLFWKYHHRLDYVGLDTTPQENFELHHAMLVSAIHSADGNVKWKLLQNDQNYSELTPGQQIQLRFLLPDNQNQKRTFILYIEGHYIRMET